MPRPQCKCGCGIEVAYSKRYVDKSHQLSHMRAGEASRMNELQGVGAKRKGGATAGRIAAESGALAARGARGAEKVRQLAAVRARSVAGNAPRGRI